MPGHSLEHLTDKHEEEQANELALLEDAQVAIERATEVRELKDIVDKAEALETYAKRVEYGSVLQRRCAEIKLRAERKAGSLLAEMTRTGRPPKPDPEKVLQEDHSGTGTLESHGVSKNQSHKWQKIATLPEDQFEQAVSDDKTERDLLRMVRHNEQVAAQAENEAKVAEAPDLDELVEAGSVFSTIVIDPPWDPGDEGDQNQFGSKNPTYATMPLAEIKELPVGHLAAPNSHLYLWITNRSIFKGKELLEAWGFRYITMLTWVKESIGVGNYYRNNTEHVIFGVKGSLGLMRADVPTAFYAPRTKRHSEKPTELYDLVEGCSPGPRLDIFGRKDRPGWATFGENGVTWPEQ